MHSFQNNTRSRNPSEENSSSDPPGDHTVFSAPVHVHTQHGLTKGGTTPVAVPATHKHATATPIRVGGPASASTKPTPATLSRSASAAGLHQFRPAASKPTSAVPTPSRPHASSQALIDQLTTERDELRRKLDATSACASRLESDLVQERARSTHLASQLDNVSNDLEKLQLTMTELRDMNATLEGTLAESVEQAEQLWIELERDRGLLAEYQDLCNDAVQENDVYRAWLARVGEDPDDERKKEEILAIVMAEAGQEDGDEASLAHE
ncbi:hypothetical protein BCR44DRAFT_71304 [Catenaria anguillulae PL171]|uniref:Uncharacterized protein n=1 Tax=Catenaria anguillulae PL171 TaxID=765915 RepID=A0A1Y2I2U0_9FUNG|nr:hypothetical protein BCR44DRAFT_71304 [Catenaria anguillulae PL171]